MNHITGSGNCHPQIPKKQEKAIKSASSCFRLRYSEKSEKFQKVLYTAA
jgi:hypothetical protein